MTEFSFEAKMVGCFRVVADDEAEARRHVAELVADLTPWENGVAVDFSLTLDDAAGPELIEIDGESV